MRKTSLILAVSLALISQASAQIVLDDFNTGATAGEGALMTGTNSWSGQVTQNATTLTVGGTAMDNNGWGNTTVNYNASAYNQLQIIAQVDTGNTPTNSFVIQFEDSGLLTNIFSVSVSAFTSTLTTVNIPIAWNTGVNANGFDATQITGWNIGGGGTGTFAFRMTFDNLVLNTAVVPEPSTYAMFAGILTLGFVAWRRRSVRA